MNVADRNRLYLQGILEGDGLFPHLESAPSAGFFAWDFGLPALPDEPGIIVIRGPRQYGKSTWLEFMLRGTLEQFGPGTALFLNGGYIAGPDELEREIQALVGGFPADARVRRLFIDEITAIAGWQKAVKRLADSGVLRQVLLVTTGSKASDIRIRMPRKASKYPFVDLLAAHTWSASRYTTPASFERSTPAERGVWWEWAVAAEHFRRAALAGSPTPTQSLFWRSDRHEVDFVRRDEPWIEVRSGRSSPFEFDWFTRSFPRETLLVVNADRFEGNRIRGVTLEDFLLDPSL